MKTELMEIKDIIITPFILLIVLFLGFILRTRYDKDSPFRKYYLPALWIKIFGATALCFVYQFYYHGGDTLGFYEGTKVFWEVLIHDFSLAVDFILSNSQNI